MTSDTNTANTKTNKQELKYINIYHI